MRADVGGPTHAGAVHRSTTPACRVCGGVTATVGGNCDRCGWRFGDAPDTDLPWPRVEVVYYLRFDERVKIGTSSRPRSRLAAIRHHELLALESGGRALEQQRHREFADLREGGEWFTLTGALTDHVATLRRLAPDPWAAYDRWRGDAFRAISS